MKELKEDSKKKDSEISASKRSITEALTKLSEVDFISRPDAEKPYQSDTNVSSRSVSTSDHARLVKLFAGGQGYSQSLAKSISSYYSKLPKAQSLSLGQSSSRKFSDGELSYSFEESIRGHDVFLLQSTPPPAETILELLLMIDAAKRASAHYVTAVVPYFGYARQDRKDRPRVCIAAKLMANVLSAAGANRIMTMDLHAGQIQGFFDIPVDHLDGSAVFVPYLESLNLKNIVFAAPDVGSMARNRSYAHYFQAELVVCDKERKRANEVASMQVIGEVKDKDVVIVDDLIDTGGTLCQAATLLKKKGARSVQAICTHAVLSGNAYERIEESPLERLSVTDTIPLRSSHSKINVLEVAPLFAQAIHSIHTNGSISSLFISPS